MRRRAVLALNVTTVVALVLTAYTFSAYLYLRSQPVSVSEWGPFTLPYTGPFVCSKGGAVSLPLLGVIVALQGFARWAAAWRVFRAVPTRRRILPMVAWSCLFTLGACLWYSSVHPERVFADPFPDDPYLGFCSHRR